MDSPGFETDEFVARPAQREEIAELQAFAESNPEYWLLTHGHPPPSDDAAQNFEWHPPADMGYSEHLWFVVRHGRDSRDRSRRSMSPPTYWLQVFITWDTS